MLQVANGSIKCFRLDEIFAKDRHEFLLFRRAPGVVARAF